LLKEINSGKVESLSRGLDPKMIHPSSSSNPRSRIQSRRTASTTSIVSASLDVPKQSSAQRSAFANELKNVLKKNNNKLSESPEIDKKILEPLELPANSPTETSDTDNLDVSKAKIEPELENATDSRTPELPPKATPKARKKSPQKDKPSVNRNGSIPKRKELKEISTQTFIPDQEEIKEEKIITEPEQR